MSVGNMDMNRIPSSISKPPGMPRRPGTLFTPAILHGKVPAPRGSTLSKIPTIPEPW